jgi:nucleoside-diphosphate-sugar epimerase
MRVLVTGASGYVPPFVIDDLAPDHDLVLCSRRPPREGPRGATAPFVRADLTVPDDCRRAVDGVDAIVHLAASTWNSPTTYHNNVLGTYHLLEAAREAGVRRMVFASSVCALGHCARVSGPLVPDTLPIDETHPESPEDSYGLSKVLNEQTMASFARAHRLDSIGLRLAHCWGPAERARRVEAPFDVAGSARAFWAYVDMRDTVQAFRLALHAAPADPPAHRVYYICAADTTADEPSAVLIARFYPELRPRAERLPGHASFFSWSAAQRDLGYTPRCSWRDEVR